MSPGPSGDQMVEEQDGGRDHITIRQLRSGSMFWIPVQIGDVKVKAFVDTAAEVIIISQEIHQRLNPPPQVIQHITLSTAGKRMHLTGTLVGPIPLLVVGREYTVGVYVAPIADDMLLGLDFMKRYGVSIVLDKSQMILQGQVTPMKLETKDEPNPNLAPCIAKVAVSQYTVIPPHSVARVKCEMDKSMPQCIVEPLEDGQVPVVHTLHQDGGILKVCVLNVTGQNITLKRRMHVANAEAVWEILPGPGPAVAARVVGRVPSETQVKLPAHMMTMVQDVEETLTAEQASQLTHLLWTFQDIFAASEFDLGSFKEVSHRIDTVDECLDTLAGNEWFSKLDANSAYYQINIAEEDRKKTAFITKYGLFEFKKMAFGLCNAPATYARVMNLVLREVNWETVLAFLDDILVLGDSLQSHLSSLAQVFERFRTYGLRLKPQKCALFKKRVEFLGRMVSSAGLELGKEAIDTVVKWQKPGSSKDLERFLGLANYHRAFIKGFAELAAPLYALTGGNRFEWGDKHQEAFAAIKMALTTAPVLGLPNGHDPFILDTDASDWAIGAELLQVQGKKEKVIAYASFALTTEQRRYCTTRKELLAVVRFTRLFRHYLLGRPFTIRTDHGSLVWLIRFKNPQDQLARWLEELSQFDLKIQHRAGKKHNNADSLSREGGAQQACTHFRQDVPVQDLPCGGCPYCRRAHQNWATFQETVDDVVPLATGSFRCACNVQIRGTIRQVSTIAPIEDWWSEDSNLAVFPWDPGEDGRRKPAETLDKEEDAVAPEVVGIRIITRTTADRLGLHLLELQEQTETRT
ncbi:uncharacterized protein [Procambarus clarkii]|uniref:uncharacterized protein n=1 Tax=Procambarus clarkii TaxID=6728 RepID=UPI00374412D6